MKEHLFETHRRGDLRFAGRGRSGSEEVIESGRGGKHGHKGLAHHSGMHGRDPFNGGRERLFDAGDLKLVILKLLAESPSYGYQLMKRMEERLSGGYTPSAGVIYPTLTMLDEEGFTSENTSDTNKKVYSVTPEGLAYLQQNKERVLQVFDRLREAGEGFRRRRSPEIIKAFHNLRGAVEARVSRQTISSEQIRKIADAINAAAAIIDKL
jgi:DNA-binding PadR family transcriptional regulator